MNTIHTETIVGSLTADTLREGAIKINNNFQLVADNLIDIQNTLCDLSNDVCSDYPKLSLTVSDTELLYSPVNVGDTLYHSGSGYDKALAEVSDTQEALGVVYHTHGDRVYIALDGYICNQQGLSAGEQYYLSSNTPGDLVTYSELNLCDVIKPIFIAISPTEAIVNIMRGSLQGLSNFEVYNFPKEEYISYNEVAVESSILQQYSWMDMKNAITFNETVVEIVAPGFSRPIRYATAMSFNETVVEIVSPAEPRDADTANISNFNNYNETVVEIVSLAIT